MNVKLQLEETLICNIKKLKVTAECRLQKHAHHSHHIFVFLKEYIVLESKYTCSEMCLTCNSKEEWMLSDSSVL